MGNFFAELKHRHIYRVAAAYAVVAWVLLQLFNNLEPILKLPDWAGTLVLVFLVGGLPVVLLLAWVRELAPADGSATRAATGRLDWALMGHTFMHRWGVTAKPPTPCGRCPPEYFFQER